MDCAICFNKYDNDKHKPYSIAPCGHSFCISCLNRIESSLTAKKCPVDRTEIENKVINRGIMDLITSPSSNKTKSILNTLKKSLLAEMKKLEKEMDASCTKKLKHIEELADSIRTEIEKDKIEKINCLERDAKIVLNKLDEVKKKLSQQCNDEINANFFSHLIKSSQKLVQEADSSKAATENSENIKKQMRKKIKILEEISFQFQSNQKMLHENSVGHIIEKKMPPIERPSADNLSVDFNKNVGATGLFSNLPLGDNLTQQAQNNIFNSNTEYNTNNGNSLGVKSNSFVDLILQQQQSHATFRMSGFTAHKRKNSSSSNDESNENASKRITSNATSTSGTSDSIASLSENVAPSTSTGRTFQIKPSVLALQPVQQATASLTDSKQPKQLVANEKTNPFFKHFKTTITETKTVTTNNSKKKSSKTNSQSSHTEASSSTMESNLPVVANVKRAPALNATASQSVIATKIKLKPVSQQPLPPPPVPEASTLSEADSGNRTSIRRKAKVDKYPK